MAEDRPLLADGDEEEDSEHRELILNLQQQPTVDHNDGGFSQVELEDWVSDGKSQQLLVTAHEIQQLEQQARAGGGQPRQLPVTADTPQAATASAAEKDIAKLRWTEGNKAPEKMRRGAAVVHGDTAYFNSSGSHKIYSYQIVSGEEQWSRLPDSPYKFFSLAVVDGHVTSVGGAKSGLFSDTSVNTLLSLTGEGERNRQWSEVFPAMPTARAFSAAVTTDDILVVAGGGDSNWKLNTVEVMNVNTKQWTTANPLPQRLTSLSGTVCGDQLYLGGFFYDFKVGIAEFCAARSVLTCPISSLVAPPSLNPTENQSPILPAADQRQESSWRVLPNLPVSCSTLTSLGGHVLAVGGEVEGTYSADVHRYDSRTDKWNVMSRMKNERSLCLAAVLPGERLVVVGGLNFSWLRGITRLDSVEIS